MMQWIFSIILFLIMPYCFAEIPSTPEKFQEIIARNENKLPEKMIDFNYYKNIVGANHPIFVAVEHIHPGQNRYAFALVKEKLIDPRQIFSSMRNRTSIYKLKEYKEGVLTKEGIVIDDGHHSVQKTIFLGANSFPVKLVADLSHLPMDKAWVELETMNRAYLTNINGKRKTPPAKFSELVDDPLRYYIAMTALKLFPHKTIKPKGTQNPLWIKGSNSIKFIEFVIADILYASGIDFLKANIYTPPFDEAIVEVSRKILTRDPYMYENYVVDTPIHTKALVNEFRSQQFIHCQALFDRLAIHY